MHGGGKPLMATEAKSRGEYEDSELHHSLRQEPRRSNHNHSKNEADHTNDIVQDVDTKIEQNNFKRNKSADPLASSSKKSVDSSGTYIQKLLGLNRTQSSTSNKYHTNVPSW